MPKVFFRIPGGPLCSTNMEETEIKTARRQASHPGGYLLPLADNEGKYSGTYRVYHVDIVMLERCKHPYFLLQHEGPLQNHKSYIINPMPASSRRSRKK